MAIAWQYAKIEIVPTMTLNFFHGPKGKSLEDNISKVTDNFIAGIRNRIDEIEAEKLREIKRKEAAAKALLDKIKAETKRKAEEATKKAEALARKVKAKAAQKSEVVSKVTSEAQKIVKEAKQAVTKKEDTVTKRKSPKNVDDKKGSPL